jgi:hypothetical protein
MCITWLQFGIHLDPFGPNFSPTALWAQVGPSWDPLGASWSQLAQVRRKLKLGPSKYAPVRSNLRPRTGKFDPSPLLVGPSRPALFLSVLFPGCGGGSRHEATRTITTQNIYNPAELNADDNEMDGLYSFCSTYAHQKPWLSPTWLHPSPHNAATLHRLFLNEFLLRIRKGHIT